MAAAQNRTYRIRDCRNVFRVTRLRVQDLREFVSREILHHLVRNDGGVLLDLGSSKSGDAFAEDPDHREIELIELDLLAERILLRKQRVGKFLGQESDFVARGHVLGIEESSAKNLQVANLLKTLSHTHHADRPLVTLDNNRHRQVTRAGDFYDFGNLLVN